MPTNLSNTNDDFDNSDSDFGAYNFDLGNHYVNDLSDHNYHNLPNSYEKAILDEEKVARQEFY